MIPRSATTRILPLLWIILVLPLFSPPVLAGQDQHRCAQCGKLISGEYCTVDGKYFHPLHFKCAQCGQPIKNLRFFENGGKYFDSTCFRNFIAPKCSYCGLPIESSYSISEGKNYHDSCYFAHIVPRCALCGDTILGQYLTDFWGNRYHSRHKGVAPRCEYCDRFISQELTGGGTKYADGRALCALCLATAVNDVDTARQILMDVRDSLAMLGIQVKRNKIPFKLIDAREMGRLNQVGAREASGFTVFEKTKYVYGLLTDRKFQLYALYGMPRSYLAAILAHELMHVWLGLNAPTYQNQAMVEGSCNYAEFLYLGLGVSPDTRFLKQALVDDPDPIYGEGFRKIRALAEARGEQAWLDYVKKNETAPW